MPTPPRIYPKYARLSSTPVSGVLDVLKDSGLRVFENPIHPSGDSDRENHVWIFRALKALTEGLIDRRQYRVDPTLEDARAHSSLLPAVSPNRSPNDNVAGYPR